MDYEKKYKEAFALMKDCIPDENGLVHVRPDDIFPELKESEDERIRKEIIRFIFNYPQKLTNRDSWLAWLEKQKGTKREIEGNSLCNGEQKPVNRSKTTAGNWYVCEMEVMNENTTTAFHSGEVYYCPKDGYIDVNGALFEVGTLDVFRLATKEEIPQPKQEWSEEDEKMYARIVRSYTSYEGRILYATNLSEDNRNNILEDLNEQELWLKYRLKSLRPHSQWKPSDEQMEYLAKAITTLGNEGDNKTSAILYELRTDLKKLKA